MEIFLMLMMQIRSLKTSKMYEYLEWNWYMTTNEVFSWKEDFLNSSYRHGKKWKTPKSSGKSIPLQRLFLKLACDCYFNMEIGKMQIKFLKARWVFFPHGVILLTWILNLDGQLCLPHQTLHQQQTWTAEQG